MSRRKLHALAAITASVWLLNACTRDAAEPTPTPAAPGDPVNFDPAQVPYPTLSAYRFFTGPLRNLTPNTGVLPYTVITPLFSDYAKKSRFVWMPPGVKAHYIGDDLPLDFPDGTVLLKSFRYDHVQPGDATRHLETRMLFRRNGQWEFANYVWNDAQTEAHLTTAGSTVPITWLHDGTLRTAQYRIPSAVECLTCHRKDDIPMPIGPKARNLRMDLAYPGGTMDQLLRWQQQGYLDGGLPPVAPITRWDDQSAPLNDRVRAYLDANCAHCHAEGSYCSYRPMRFAWQETTDPVNLGICVPPEDPLLPALTHIVSSGNIQRSMLHYRLASTDEAVRMPLIGRSVVHEEALQLIEAWINELSPPCN